MSGDKSKEPPTRRWRGIATGIGLIVLLVTVALGSAFIFRDDLAQAVLKDRLNELGLENVHFQIERISPDTLTIANFSADAAVSFDRLTLTFTAAEILEGRLRRVDLLGLKLDLTQPEPWTSLKNQPDSEGDGKTHTSFDLAIMPIVNVRRAAVIMPSPAGPRTITAAISMQPTPDGDLAVQANASTAGSPDKINVSYDGTVRIDSAGNRTAAGTLRAAIASLAVDNIAAKTLTIDFPLTIEANTAGKTIASGRLTATSGLLTAGKTKLASMHVDFPLSVALTGNNVTVIASETASFEATGIDLDGHRNADQLGATITGRLKAKLPWNGAFDSDARIAFAAPVRSS